MISSTFVALQFCLPGCHVRYQYITYSSDTVSFVILVIIALINILTIKYAILGIHLHIF